MWATFLAAPFTAAIGVAIRNRLWYRTRQRAIWLGQSQRLTSDKSPSFPGRLKRLWARADSLMGANFAPSWVFHAHVRESSRANHLMTLTSAYSRCAKVRLGSVLSAGHSTWRPRESPLAEGPLGQDSHGTNQLFVKMRLAAMIVTLW